MHGNRARRGEGVQVRVEVLADRRRQVLGRARFGGREQSGPHSLGLPLQLGENVFSR